MNPKENNLIRKTPWQLMWLRLSRNRMAIVGLVAIALFICTALLAPYLAPYNPLKQNLLLISQGPNAQHWLGCDQVGRDIFSRIIHGTAVTFKIALTSVLMGLFLGTAIGAIGGYYGGKVDAGVVFLADILLAFPGLLLAIAIVAAVGTGLGAVIIATGFSTIPQFIRVTRSVVMGEKERDYVLAAQAIGENHRSIIVRYILPNCIAPIVVLLTLRLAAIILIASGLSFLGLGVQPPTPEWGAMLAEGRGYLQKAPHIAMFPGLAIMIVVLAFNLLGDGLRDALDPKMKI